MTASELLVGEIPQRGGQSRRRTGLFREACPFPAMHTYLRQLLMRSGRTDVLEHDITKMATPGANA
jgi:hypothetical protein